MLKMVAGKCKERVTGSLLRKLQRERGRFPTLKRLLKRRGKTLYIEGFS